MKLDDIKKMLDNGDLHGGRLQLLELVEQGQATEGVWLLLAGIGMRTNDARLALRAYRALEETRPRDAYVASGIVDSLMRLEQYDEARDVIAGFAKVVRRGSAFNEAVLEEHQDALRIIEQRTHRLPKPS